MSNRSEAVLHLYLGTPLWPAASDLAHALGSKVQARARVQTLCPPRSLACSMLLSFSGLQSDRLRKHAAHFCLSLPPSPPLSVLLQLLAEASGGSPFDEACGGFWWALQVRAFAGGGAPPRSAGGKSIDAFCDRRQLALLLPYSQRAHPDKPIPPANLTATVELRGGADVSDELAASDALGLVRSGTQAGMI